MDIVVENRRQPTLTLADSPTLALRVILDLIAFDFADTEIRALWVAEIEAAHRSAWPHGETFR